MYTDTQDLPGLIVTGIGSLPFTDAATAVELILNNVGSAPHQPQLSKAEPREQMWIQFSENIPRFKADFDDSKYHFDTSGDYLGEIERFYSDYLAVMEGGSAEKFAVGPEFGGSIHEFLQRVRSSPNRFPILKLQVTGPLSFALTIPDETGRPIFYNEVFKDIAIKAIGLKAMWLLEQFAPYADKTIIFFDEPCLSAYGSSAYMTLSRSEVIAVLDEVCEMALQRGGIPGVHCCGNTAWGMLMDTQARIISFDAVEYGESFAMYGRQTSDFLSKGGILAWGAAPNTDRVNSETAELIVERIRRNMKRLEESGIPGDLLRRRIMITPACGCSGMSDEDTLKLYGLLRDLEQTGRTLLNNNGGT
jgi:hypothetical protein